MKNKTITNRIIGCMFLAVLIIGCGAKTEVPKENSFEEKNLSDFNHILENYRNGVLANRDGEKLRTQIMTFSFTEENRAYFCTTSDKPLYEQLVSYPYVSYCTFPEDWEPVLSLNGKVVFVDDKATKELALESNYYAKNNFKSADNPLLKVFYIDVETIETFGYEGTNIYSAK